MTTEDLLQIAVGHAAPTAAPQHHIRKPVPREVSAYLRTRKGVGWQQLQHEVAEAFGITLAPNTLLKHRDGGGHRG